MGLPGEAIKKIRDAITSAFPNRSDLTMMLRIELDIPESEVPDDPDYKLVVFNLVQELERQGRIPELIEGALNERSGNSDLQKLPQILAELIYKLLKNSPADVQLKEFAKEINLIALKNLLIPLEQKFFEEIKEAYLACCPENLRDWEPETIKDIFDELKHIHDGTPESPIIQFMLCLLDNQRFSPSVVKNLKKWGERNTKNFSQLLNRRNNKGNATIKNESLPSYLIIQIERSKQYPRQKRYRVSAWFVPDGRSDKFDLTKDKGCKYLEVKHYQKDAFSLKEIPSLLENFRKQSSQYMTDSPQLPIIVFLLPRALLNEPVESWQIRTIPIGIQHQVLLQTCERANNYEFKNIWVNKWKYLQQVQYLCTETVISGNCDWNSLVVQLMHEEAICLKLNQQPSNKIYDAIYETAIPVAIWLRCDRDNIDAQSELEELLQFPLTALPERVRIKRSEAFRNREQDWHIGHHLSLLWENPYILPPAINYDTP